MASLPRSPSAKASAILPSGIKSITGKYLFPQIEILFPMVEFKFITYGTDFGTRDMGQKLREKLLPLINGHEKVVLDFTGVNVVSNSFADECIAKLLLEMPLAELKRRTTFRGLNPLAERSVLVALQRRYKVLSRL